MSLTGFCRRRRYLVETPANFCTPQYLAETAARVAALAPERFHLDVLERPAVEALGMGLYLGVAQVGARVQDLRDSNIRGCVWL